MGRISVRLGIFAALVLAFYCSGLASTPAHLHHDEAIIALQAHSVATTGRDIEGRALPLYFFMPQLGDRAWYQPTIIYLGALVLQVLPASEAAYRVPTALVATLDVVLMFFVARRLFQGERWAWAAAVLLAATPTHILLGRVAFDFLFPLPFILGWLWALLVFLDTRQPSTVFIATSVLGLGFYSYISSMLMMPIYFVLTIGVLAAYRLLSSRLLAIATAGFAWPLLLLVPWLLREPTFIQDVLHRYSMSSPDRFHVSAIVDRVNLYWTFLNPAFLFLFGGFTHLTASTRLFGVFLLPLIVLVPAGLMQMATRVRTPMSVLVFLGFMLAPLAAVLTVQEPYASSRQASIMVFGVLIAIYGLQRIWSWRTPAASAFAYGITALLPVWFVFFAVHYFGAYRGYSAAQFEYNHRDALAAIVAHAPRDRVPPIFLSNGRDKWMDAFWRLTLSIDGRGDLLAHTEYFDSATLDDVRSIPPGALVLVTTDDKTLLDGIGSGAFTEVMHATEPADEPVYYVLRRNPV